MAWRLVRNSWRNILVWLVIFQSLVWLWRYRVIMWWALNSWFSQIIITNRIYFRQSPYKRLILKSIKELCLVEVMNQINTCHFIFGYYHGCVVCHLSVCCVLSVTRVYCDKITANRFTFTRFSLISRNFPSSTTKLEGGDHNCELKLGWSGFILP